MAIIDKIRSLISGSSTDYVLKDNSGTQSSHLHTKAQVGLGSVDNTSDADKPISTATQTAMNGKVDKVSGKGLSTNDYTTAEKNKLAGIETGANKTVVDSALSSTSTNPVQNKAIKTYVDNKSWFKNNTTLSAIQNSNAYYQCVSARTEDFSCIIKLYDVTEFFDGTIVNQQERSVFFGDMSLIRDAGNAGCKYARVCAMIGYNSATSNTIVQSDDENCQINLVKEEFDYLTPNVTKGSGAYIIENGTAVFNTTYSNAKAHVYDISDSSGKQVAITSGIYGNTYGTTVKCYIFVDDNFTVYSYASSDKFSGWVDIPTGATKLIVHIRNSYTDYPPVGPKLESPRYFLIARPMTGWPAGMIEYFGRFYTRTTAGTVAGKTVHARPLLLKYVQNHYSQNSSILPAGYSVVKECTYVGRVSKANYAKYLEGNGRISSADLAHIYDNDKAHVRLDVATSSMTTGKPRTDGYILTFTWDTSGIYDQQIFIPDPGASNQNWQIRGRLGSGYSEWRDFAVALADKATADASGNTITTTYATKTDISGKQNVDGSNATAAGMSTAFNKLETGSENFIDTDYIISSDHTSGHTTSTTFVRRTFMMLFNRIKEKLDSVYAADSDVVHKAGTETITGKKTLTQGLLINAPSSGSAYFEIERTDSGQYDTGLRVKRSALGSNDIEFAIGAGGENRGFYDNNGIGGWAVWLDASDNLNLMTNDSNASSGRLVIQKGSSSTHSPLIYYQMNHDNDSNDPQLGVFASINRFYGVQLDADRKNKKYGVYAFPTNSSSSGKWACYVDSNFIASLGGESDTQVRLGNTIINPSSINADTVDGWHISVGTLSTHTDTISFL